METNFNVIIQKDVLLTSCSILRTENQNNEIVPTNGLRGFHYHDCRSLPDQMIGVTMTFNTLMFVDPN